VDIFTKWHQRFFYFCAKYRCVHENYNVPQKLDR
jgi:hypothetical protein